MGKGPNLQEKIKENSINVTALDAAVSAKEAKLDNSYDKGIAFINANTKGIIDGGVITSNVNSYSKYSDSYSLDVLTPIIDGTVKFAVDYLEGGEEGLNASKMAGDVGTVVKGILSLFASSSTTDESVKQIFAQFRKGEDNYAIYYASNSGSINADNAWGNKSLIVVTNIYIFAQVNENKDITQAEVRQHILDNLKKAKETFSDALALATTDEEVAEIEKHQAGIKRLDQEYNDEQ